MDKGGGETGSDLLPASAGSNLASSNGRLANGGATAEGQEQRCAFSPLGAQLEAPPPPLSRTAGDSPGSSVGSRGFHRNKKSRGCWREENAGEPLLLLVVQRGDHPLSEPGPLFLQGQTEWPVALYGGGFYDVVRAVGRPAVPLWLAAVLAAAARGRLRGKRFSPFTGAGKSGSCSKTWNFSF